MHEYRLIVIRDDGKRFILDRVSELEDARSLLAGAREKYDMWNDVYVERRELGPWSRYEPPVPHNQPSLPL
jgi:hypothetical protein